MSRLVAGTLLLPDGTPMAGASIYFTAKRTEPDAIVKGIDAFFKTNSTGIYSQEIENGWYTVTIEYQLSGTYPRRWSLGEVVIEDGPTTTLNALIIAMTPPDDPNLGIFQQLLLEAQEARDEAIAAANTAQEAAATISPEKQAQWDEAYSDRMKWNGGADGLNAVTGRASLQLKSAALQESTAFATAAQGATADNAIPVSQKGSANGVATLDSGGVVPESQLPDFIKSDQRGVANGVATLGANALIPPSQLPSYVDDVLEVETFGDLPVEGEAGKIYIVKTAGTAGGDPFPANQQFRWSGTAYIKLVASPGTTDNVVEGLVNLYFTGLRAISAKLTGFVAAVEEFAVSPADSVLGALQKVVGRLNQLGTAANLNVGTGVDDLPMNANLNMRLGTTGNLGAAATRDVVMSPGDVDPERVVTPGWMGIGSKAGVDAAGRSVMDLEGGLWYTNNALDPFSSARAAIVARGIRSFAIAARGTSLEFRTWGGDALEGLYSVRHTGNTTVDSNGFIKNASPITKLFSDHAESNEGAKGVTLDKLAVGRYQLVTERRLATEGWYIETPKDANGNIKVFVKYKENAEGILIETYEPDYSTGRVVAGNPVDIPHGRWIDVRMTYTAAETAAQIAAEEAMAAELVAQAEAESEGEAAGNE